jgi:hypothetical protein
MSYPTLFHQHRRQGGQNDMLVEIRKLFNLFAAQESLTFCRPVDRDHERPQMATSPMWALDESSRDLQRVSLLRSKPSAAWKT